MRLGLAGTHRVDLNLLPTKARDARLASTEMSSLPSPSQRRPLLSRVPAEILRRLEHLAFVKDPDDLGAKYAQAIAWFREAIEAIDERQVRRLIHGTTTRQVVTPGSRVALHVLPDRRLREGV